MGADGGICYVSYKQHGSLQRTKLGRLKYVEDDLFSRFYKIANFVWYQIKNSHEADRLENKEEFQYVPKSNNLIGYYGNGVGCTRSLGDFVTTLKNILDMNPYKYRTPINWIIDGEDIRDYTFQKIMDKLKNIPSKHYAKYSEFLLFKFHKIDKNQFDMKSPHSVLEDYSSCLDVLLGVLLYYTFFESINEEVNFFTGKEYLTEEIKKLTVREWANEVAKCIDLDSYREIETWT